MKTLRWGLLGTGRIAGIFAKGLTFSKTGQLVAVGSRTSGKAEAFGKQIGITKCHGSYKSLLGDSEVDAIYVSTPHPLHAEWAIKATEAGKHVLCEKPIGLNWAQGQAIVEAAVVNKVFLMEAFMYRCHPQIEKVIEMIRSGTLGEIRMVQASFGYSAVWNLQSRIFANEMGGGGILDVGCYPSSFAQLIANVISGKDGSEPDEVQGTAHLGETGVDEQAAAVLKYPGGLVAQISTSIRTKLENGAWIHGTEGALHLPHPWVITAGGGKVELLLRRNSSNVWENIEVPQVENIYGVEADRVAENIERLQAASPGMTWADTLANMKTLDRWRKAAKFQYESEKIPKLTRTITGRPLRVSLPSRMRYLPFQGSAKKVSQLVLGSTIHDAENQAYLYDAYFESGGTAFDSAWIYGALNEQGLGQWVKSREIREQVFIIAKGAHTPFCNPKHLTTQLAQSIERQQVDYFDLYMMHRDNPEIPIGEFIDVLNEHVGSGRIRAFGASNFETSRVDEGNDYAEKKGLVGFSAISNQFSLAKMIDPVWPGAISANHPETLAWLRKKKIPLFAWSSQSRGFFTAEGDPLTSRNAEVRRCWMCEENFRRRERTIQLAERRGVLPINIALAYALQQDFLLYALVGPLQQSEWRSTSQVLDLELTSEEMSWLNLETDECGKRAVKG